MSDITKQAQAAICELLQKAKLQPGDLVVVGCSSSEIAGGVIGHASSLVLAEEAFEGIYPVLQENGLFLAAQCCEHLNRALIVEREVALSRGCTIVSVVPKEKAGGSFATTAWKRFQDPVAVEFVQADAGLDIGQTMIGMHLKHVAVPARLETKRIGQAVLTAATTRPKYIGGIRAQYE